MYLLNLDFLNKSFSLYKIPKKLNWLKIIYEEVYIIEEAFELLEAQIISFLEPHIEHLIMIGDE